MSQVFLFILYNDNTEALVKSWNLFFFFFFFIRTDIFVVLSQEANYIRAKISSKKVRMKSEKISGGLFHLLFFFFFCLLVYIKGKKLF